MCSQSCDRPAPPQNMCCFSQPCALLAVQQHRRQGSVTLFGPLPTTTYGLPWQQCQRSTPCTQSVTTCTHVSGTSADRDDREMHCLPHHKRRESQLKGIACTIYTSSLVAMAKHEGSMSFCSSNDLNAQPISREWQAQWGPGQSPTSWHICHPQAQCTLLLEPI